MKTINEETNMINAVFDIACSRFLSDVHRIDPDTNLPICEKDYWRQKGEWLFNNNEKQKKLAEKFGYDFSRITCIHCIRILRKE